MSDGITLCWLHAATWAYHYYTQNADIVNDSFHFILLGLIRLMFNYFLCVCFFKSIFYTPLIGVIVCVTREHHIRRIFQQIEFYSSDLPL